MVVIQSLGALVAMHQPWYPITNYGSIRLYDQFNYDYAKLYKTQPNVRTCVDFLARNIAQLGLHVFRRVSETDRQRLRDHPLAQIISTPLPAEFKLTRYRLIEALMGDLGVYFNAYWLKIRQPDRLGLLRIPPPMVSVSGALFPTKYEIDMGGTRKPFAPSEIVHFRGYNAENAVSGLSPLETLRRILAEEHSAGDYREHLWQNAARMHGIIERPASQAEWSTEARARFKAEFEALYSGGENSGKTAILEEDMTWKPMTFNAQESEYLEGRKLTREECARAYHIPLPMVGILDNATFSNIKEQHKNLYQDSLGPWLAMIEQEIDLQVLPEFEDQEGVYSEFNIAEKLQGSFEEQVKALQSAVGRPWMTANEARAKMNLPSMEGDADELVTPLNVLVGGQASPRDASSRDSGVEEPKSHGGGKSQKDGEFDPTQPVLRERYQEKWARLLVRTFERQRAAVLGILDKGGHFPVRRKETPDIAVLWDAERWDRELTADFYRLSTATAMGFARYVAGELDFELDEEEMQVWLMENARIAAELVNESTQEQIGEALLADGVREAIGGVFELALGVRAGQIALGRVTTLANFGSQEGARQGGLRTKTWHVNSGNPRPSHQALHGTTVGIRDTFPNGLRWPGDPRGSAEENANCGCSVTFGRAS